MCGYFSWRTIKHLSAHHSPYPNQLHSTGRNVVTWPHRTQGMLGNKVSSWVATCPAKIRAWRDSSTMAIPCLFPRERTSSLRLAILIFPRPQLWPSCSVTWRPASRFTSSSLSEFQERRGYGVPKGQIPNPHSPPSRACFLPSPSPLASWLHGGLWAVLDPKSTFWGALNRICGFWSLDLHKSLHFLEIQVPPL